MTQSDYDDAVMNRNRIEALKSAIKHCVHHVSQENTTYASIPADADEYIDELVDDTLFSEVLRELKEIIDEYETADARQAENEKWSDWRQSQ